MNTYLHPHVCFDCRKSFRREACEEPRPCPDCGGPAVALNRKFKTPPKKDRAQWEKVRYLVEQGCRFGKVLDESGERVPYPRTLEEAKAFVERHRGRLSGMNWDKLSED